MEMKTSKKNWNISGINMISTDSIYQKIKESIESGNLSQKYLQNVTGHFSPIIIDWQLREIEFYSF